METKLFFAQDYAKLIPFLKNGEVVGFPTDTVYGLAVLYHDKEAFLKLAQVKQRAITKPVSMMVADVEQIKKVAYVDKRAEKIIRAFMPGAITLILPAKENLPFHVTLGEKTVGIRIPTNDVALHILKEINEPLLVTSANLSSNPALMKFEDVKQTFFGKIAALIQEDAWQTKASTVVDATKEEIKILREGPIKIDMIMKVIEER